MCRITKLHARDGPRTMALLTFCLQQPKAALVFPREYELQLTSGR